MGSPCTLGGLLIAVLLLARPTTVCSAWYNIGLGWNPNETAPAAEIAADSAPDSAPESAPSGPQLTVGEGVALPAFTSTWEDGSPAESVGSENAPQGSNLEDFVKLEKLTPSASGPESNSPKSVQIAPGVYANADDVPCNPHGQDDMCNYIQSDAGCWQERQSVLVDYKKFYYCTCGGGLFGMILLALWSMVIFYALAVAADQFFCPAVDTISEIFKLPPDVAGATLLSFGNGAPDVFTQVAAITHGSRPDVLLALSSVLGSGFYINCAIMGIVVMVAPQPLSLDWTFRRDTLAYLGAVLLILVFMADGEVQWYQSTFLFIYYIGYLTLVICFGTKTAAEPDMEAPNQYVKRTNTVREFGIHPTMTWLRNLVQWDNLSLFQKICSPVTAPVKVALSLTMTPSEPGRVYGAVMSVCGAFFFLVAIGLSTNDHSRFFFIFFSMVILSAAMYSASSVELVTGAWLMPMVTFVQAILWMKLSAGTLVELLEVVGMVAGVPPAFLGATLLAWGASTADLAANVSVARRNPRMAVAACVAGPLFNLLAGMSSSLLYQNVMSGPVEVHLDNGILLLIAATALLMLYFAVFVPTLHAYLLGPKWSNVLLGGYALFTGVYVLQQMGEIFVDPWI